MTCKQCKYVAACMAEVDSLGQVFDPNYDGEHRCTDFVPFTNADRIRAMSNEELCEFLGEYKFCDICKEGCDNCTYNGDCDKRLLDWLQQPAE